MGNALGKTMIEGTRRSELEEAGLRQKERMQNRKRSAAWRRADLARGLGRGASVVQVHVCWEGEV